MSLETAIQELREAGAVFAVSIPDAHISLAEAARRLECSVSYIRQHKEEFPGMWRMPGGELRIPVRDVAALAERNKLRRSR